MRRESSGASAKAVKVELEEGACFLSVTAGGYKTLSRKGNLSPLLCRSVGATSELKRTSRRWLPRFGVELSFPLPPKVSYEAQRLKIDSKNKSRSLIAPESSDYEEGSEWGISAKAQSFKRRA